MDEADAGAVRARASELIKELGARGPGLLQRGAHVIGGVGDVMDRLTSIPEELFHFRLRIERGDQLDPALPDRDDRDLDALALETLASDRSQSQAALVDPNRLVEITDGDPNMVDSAQHGVDSKAGLLFHPLTRYGPFVVGFTTASYIILPLPLFTRRPLR